MSCRASRPAAEALSQRGIFRQDAPANHDAGSAARAHFKEAMMRFYQQRPRFYCGVDLHARTMYLCVLDPAGQPLLHANYPADPRAFLDAVAPFRDGLVVAVECARLA